MIRQLHAALPQRSGRVRLEASCLFRPCVLEYLYLNLLGRTFGPSKHRPTLRAHCLPVFLQAYPAFLTARATTEVLNLACVVFLVLAVVSITRPAC